MLKFSEIWYVNASQQKKIQQKKIDFGLFWPFLGIKQLKVIKNVDNWQNPNRLIKFSEVWYINAFIQNKFNKENYF